MVMPALRAPRPSRIKPRLLCQYSDRAPPDILHPVLVADKNAPQHAPLSLLERIQHLESRAAHGLAGRD